MQSVFGRVFICLLGIWLAVFVPLTVSFHHHPQEGRESDGRSFLGDPTSHGKTSPGGVCDICARLLMPVDIELSGSAGQLSEFRDISLNRNDVPVSIQLVSSLKGRSPPLPAACS